VATCGRAATGQARGGRGSPGRFGDESDAVQAGFLGRAHHLDHLAIGHGAVGTQLHLRVRRRPRGVGQALRHLLGTVWGIYHALTGIASAGQISIDKVAGPVGESLIMTAAGLVVAIPAVLGYNVFGRRIGRIEADLEGFARDLRELVVHHAQASSGDAGPSQFARVPSGRSATAPAASVGAL
jgi:hypothetical protein